MCAPVIDTLLSDDDDDDTIPNFPKLLIEPEPILPSVLVIKCGAEA